MAASYILQPPTSTASFLMVVKPGLEALILTPQRSIRLENSLCKLEGMEEVPLEADTAPPFHAQAMNFIWESSIETHPLMADNQAEPRNYPLPTQFQYHEEHP